MTVMAKSDAPEGETEAVYSQIARGTAYLPDGSTRAIAWAVPEEVPVALQINTEDFAVMMATPADLRDLAVGLVLTEGLVASPESLKGVLVMPVENGVTVDIAVDEADVQRARIAKRAMEGRTGCGLCGVETIADALKPLPRLTNRYTPDPAAILEAAAALPGHQPMNRVNRTVHGAAWVSPSGKIELVREDVGRHNALDKLIGALTRAGTDTSKGFVLMTSRCSFELVQKCAISGIGALVTVSAPTALALQLAEKSGMYLAALGAGGVVVFNA